MNDATKGWRATLKERWSLDLFSAAYNRMSRHGADGLAAGVAFGTLLSAAPLLLVVLAVAGQVLGEGAAKNEVLDLVRDALGGRSSRLVSSWIDEVREWSTTATVLGVGFFVFGSNRLGLLIDAAFEVIFEVERAAPMAWMASLRAYLKLHLTSLAVTWSAALLLVISVLLRAGAPWLLGPLFHSPVGWLLLHALTFGLLFGAVALVYRFLPPRRLSKHEIAEGTLVTTVLLELGLLLLGWITPWIEFGAAYGAASAVVGTLVALYLAAQVFLFGAEITAELALRRSGARASP